MEKSSKFNFGRQCPGAVLMFEENLAVARVLKEGWVGSIDLTDVLLMLKLDGQWKV